MNKKYETRQSRATTWLKFYSENHLWGSTRSELNPDERAVWVDFLCLAAMKFGQVEVFSREQLAKQLLINPELLDRSIEKFLKYGKIKKKYSKREKKEIFNIVKWEHYQAPYLTKRLKESSTYEEKERIDKSKKFDPETEAILEKRRGKEITLKEITSEDIKKSISKNAKNLNTEASEGSSSLSSSSNAFAEEEKSIKEAFLSKLKDIPDYPYDAELDSMLFDDIETECPSFDILKHLDEEIAWLIGVPEYTEKVSDFRQAIKRMLKDDYEEEKRINAK